MALPMGPDRIVARLLDRPVAPDLDLRLGISLFTGPPRAMNLDPTLPAHVPGRCVFVLTVGGGPPDTQHDRQVMRTSALQVWVRGPRGNFDEGQEMARGAWAALHDTRPDGLMVVQCEESEPHYNGAQEDHHEWVIALRVQYFTTTGGAAA